MCLAFCNDYYISCSNYSSENRILNVTHVTSLKAFLKCRKVAASLPRESIATDAHRPSHRLPSSASRPHVHIEGDQFVIIVLINLPKLANIRVTLRLDSNHWSCYWVTSHNLQAK